jgi:hypothetical protein
MGVPEVLGHGKKAHSSKGKGSNVLQNCRQLGGTPKGV